MPNVCYDQNCQTHQRYWYSYKTNAGREKEEENGETGKVDAYHGGSFSEAQFEKLFLQLGPVSEEECCDYYERNGRDKEQVCELGLVVVEGQQQTDFVSYKSCSEPVKDGIEPVEPLIPPSDTHPAGYADQGNTIPEVMKMDPALHHNRVGKQGREQSRAKEADYEGEGCDEGKSMPELAP